MNSIFNDMRPIGGANSFSQIISQFNQWRSTFNGNPEAQVKSMLQNGQMSQDQFNQIAQMANQLLPLIK